MSCLPPGVGAESGAVRGWVGGSGAVPGASVRPLCLLLVNCHLPIDLTGRSDFRRALNQRIRGHCDARRRVGEAGRAIGTKSRVLGAFGAFPDPQGGAMSINYGAPGES